MYDSEHWAHSGGPAGGSVSALALGPDGHCYAATLVGLYHSSDGGQHWEPCSKDQRLHFLSAVVAARGPDGQPLLLTGSLKGGLLRSNDAGRSWTQGDCGGQQLRSSTLALSPDFQHDGLAFMGTLEDGIWRSSDGGASWQACNFGLLDLSVLYLAISPTFAQDQMLFAATSTGLFRSPNGGRAWREVDFPVTAAPVQCLVLSPDFAEQGLMLAGTESAGLFRSTDWGGSWTGLGNPEPGSSINALAVLPGDAGEPILLAAARTNLYRSHDGGASWQLCANLPASLLCLAVEPNSGPAPLALAGLAGSGVYRATADLEHWEPASEGLYGRLLTGLALGRDQAARRTICVFGPGEGLLASTDEGVSWEELDEGLPSSELTAVVPLDGPAQEPLLYAALPEGIFQHSGRDAGWRQLTDLPAQLLAASSTFTRDGTLVAASISQGLWLSHDRGSSWRAIPAPDLRMLALALSPSFAEDGRMLVAGSRPDGEIEVWWGGVDGGWTQLIRSGQASLSAQLLVGTSFPRDGRCYAAIGAEIYRPQPRAAELRRGIRLPFFVGCPVTRERPTVLALAALPRGTRETLIAATNHGMFASDNGGAHWQPTGPLPHPYVSLAAAPNGRSLYALELGGRLWRLDR